MADRREEGGARLTTVCWASKRFGDEGREMCQVRPVGAPRDSRQRGWIRGMMGSASARGLWSRSGRRACARALRGKCGDVEFFGDAAQFLSRRALTLHPARAPPRLAFPTVLCPRLPLVGAQRLRRECSSSKWAPPRRTRTWLPRSVRDLARGRRARAARARTRPHRAPPLPVPAPHTSPAGPGEHAAAHQDAGEHGNQVNRASSLPREPLSGVGPPSSPAPSLRSPSRAAGDQGPPGQRLLHGGVGACT
jgi:hypothetical protein